MNNKDADQHVLPFSLISAFVNRYLHSIIPIVGVFYIKHASVSPKELQEGECPPALKLPPPALKLPSPAIFT